ncbi:MFS transporter [Minwuia sp.]|uniref:MFS transporter n=1 Tax=Minwuia sp. TaxID=2493630 RepID=UPI003A93DA73
MSFTEAGGMRRGVSLIAFGAFMCLISSVGQTYFISLFGGELRAAFDLSHGEFGLIYMIGTIASGATLILFGRIVDFLSLNNSSFIVLLGLAGVAAFAGLAWSPVALTVAIFGLRLFGQGMSTHVGITAMARHFQRFRGRAISIASLGHAIGVAASPAFVIFLLAQMDWRQAWFATAVLVIVLVPIVPLLLRGTGWRKPEAEVSVATAAAVRSTGARADYTLGQALRDPGLWLRLPALLAPAFISTGFFFHQVHLAASKGWDIDVMAYSFSAFAVATVLGLLIGGALVDWLSARRLVSVFLAPLAASCAVLWAGNAAWSAPVFLGLMGFGAGLTQVLLGALWAELYGVRYIGSIRSFATAMMVFSTGLAPFIMGAAIDVGVTMERIAVWSALYCVGASVFSTMAARAFERRLRNDRP